MSIAAEFNVNAGDTAWMLMSCGLVNLMTPGLAFFYGGLVRQQNVLTMIMQNYVSMGLMTIVWVMWGYSMCFGEIKTSYIWGNPASHAMLAGIENDSGSDGEGIPGVVFAAFQGMFAVITPALMTGAFADRVMFKPYLLFIFLWIHLVYYPFCHWIWGGGWMFDEGVWDFAGGIVVHCTAGFGALAVVMALPHRKKLEPELDTDPHNIPFVALGTALLWFGWFGFNGGSALGANQVAGYALINTEISASCALFVWLMIEWAHKGKPTLVGACVGAIAGLATVTPAAGYVYPWAAMVIGCLAAPWCYFLIEVVKNKFDLDDALDVFAVHGMGGYLGTLLIGVLADDRVYPDGPNASGKQFFKQLWGASFCAVYAFVVSFGLIKAINLVMPVLPPSSHLSEGLDTSIHGEKAYKENSQSGTEYTNPLKAAQAV